MPIIDKSFHERHFGGPHGLGKFSAHCIICLNNSIILGDPDDRTLRKVEKEVLVAKKMRDKAKEEKCQTQVKAFTKCCVDTGLLMVVKCRKENADLKECLTDWYTNEEFKEQCTEEYLAERSEYRRTGIGKKQRDARLASNI